MKKNSISFFFLWKPKVGHEIMWKYFANNCLLNASILNHPVGLYEGMEHTSFSKIGKKSSKKYEISNQDRALCASQGGLLPMLNDDEAFCELRGKRFARHIWFFLNTCAKAPERSITLPQVRFNAQLRPKVISSYVTLWQHRSTVSAMGYPGFVPMVIPSDATAHKLSSQPSQRLFSSRFERYSIGCGVRIPTRCERVRNTCLNINKERAARRQWAEFFICTCQYFYYTVMSELFITVFTTRSLFIGNNVSEFTCIRWVNACLNIKSITFPLIIFVMALKVSILSTIILKHIYIQLISLYRAVCFVAFGSIITLQMSCVKLVNWTFRSAVFISARKGFCRGGAEIRRFDKM